MVRRLLTVLVALTMFSSAALGAVSSILCLTGTCPHCRDAQTVPCCGDRQVSDRTHEPAFCCVVQSIAEEARSGWAFTQAKPLDFDHASAILPDAVTGGVARPEQPFASIEFDGLAPPQQFLLVRAPRAPPVI